LADANAAAVEWYLSFQTLTDSERDALAQFHGSVEGSLSDFTFLDPTDNLLCWSEALDQSVWERNLLLTITASVADPLGGTATANQSSAYEIGPDWTPLLLSGKFAGTDPSVTFGIQVQPGGSVDLFAIQVEAQIGASGYKKTLSSSGVYPNARFLDDALAIQADGPSQHSCQIRIHTQA
jgi:hypothetical protein